MPFFPKGFPRVSMSILAILLVAYLTITVFLYLTQARFIYFPMRDLMGTPQDVGLEYDVVDFQAADGVKLNGWYVPADQAMYTVLFCHGNGGNISVLLGTISQFHRLGMNVFVFDYRGYGASEGKPDEEGTYLDVEAAREYLLRDRGATDNRMILVGRSLGGGVASWLAVKYPPRALFLESTFTSLADLASEIYPFFPVRTLLQHEYPTIKRLRDIRCPVLVVHSPTDEIIPYHHGERLYESANAPKEFMEILGGHNDGFQISALQYEEGIKTFLRLYAGVATLHISL